MILTGPAIEEQRENGRIFVGPFDPDLVGPNSIDLRLGGEISVYADVVQLPPEHLRDRYPPSSTGGCLDMRSKDHRLETFEVGKRGAVLWPGVLYLGRTVEIVNSDYYVPIVEGRSSIGRLGMGVHVTAGFCDVGFKGSITLEITVVHPLRVYADEPVCQAYFLTPEGKLRLYAGRYQGQEAPTASRFNQGKK